jgi:hypothetical protein
VSFLEARKAAGKPFDKPNLVMNAAVQVCWEKAARYLEVEERYWYCTADKYCLDPQEAVALCDENTIMVCAILGSTYTGEYEDVKTLNDLLLMKNESEGLNVHIHVDAASGGFVAPFVKPDLVWDFRLPLVCGINVSGHKYGLEHFSRLSVVLRLTGKFVQSCLCWCWLGNMALERVPPRIHPVYRQLSRISAGEFPRREFQFQLLSQSKNQRCLLL